MNKRGVTLIASIMLIIFASVAVLGVTTFVVQQLYSINAKEIHAKCLYLAQAGMNRAIYDFRFNDLNPPSANGYFSLGQVNVDADNYFVLGGTAADLLMVDTSSAQIGTSDCDVELQECLDACGNQCYEQCDADYDACAALCKPGNPGKGCRKKCVDERDNVCYPACGGPDPCHDQCNSDYQSCLAGGGDDKRLTQIILQNATDSQPITIDRMIVTWDNNRKLREIMIDGVTRWTGNGDPGVDADLDPDVILGNGPPPSTHLIDYLRFNAGMGGSQISIEFIMSDGTSRVVDAYPASNNYFNFVVKSTGKVTGSDMYRTIQADYDAPTGKVTDYHEADAEITP